MTQPLIVITGPTASGKSSLALELAQMCHGEIICADSRTVYKGMDIGTAKPSLADQAQVPHHLLDMVEPGQRFTAKDFQSAAYRAISEIRSRGNVPFLVGGTGLYIDAVTLDYQWPESEADASEYQGKTVTELQMMLKKQHITMPENKYNKRHLVSALVRHGAGSSRSSPLENTHVVAIATEKLELRNRILSRTNELFANGVIDETKRLAGQYGWGSEAMTSNIYPIIHRLIDGEITLEEAKEVFITRDMQLAKRQITWLKRHSFVQWLSLDEARAQLTDILC